MIDRLAVRNRPTGLPIMHQRWCKLLFLHWRVDAAGLRSLLPPALELDTYDGSAWIGITPFEITGIRPLFLPSVPVVSQSLELNVRTYVVHEGIPGVWFFSLDADNPLAVPAAKLAFRLPYRHARMKMSGANGAFQFRSERQEGEAPRPSFGAEWRLGEPLSPPPPESLEFFLVERYCLYARHRSALYRSRIHHRPWPLRSADLVSLESTMLELQGLPAPQDPPHLLAQGSPLDVEIWPLTRVGAT